MKLTDLKAIKALSKLAKGIESQHVAGFGWPL